MVWRYRLEYHVITEAEMRVSCKPKNGEDYWQQEKPVLNIWFPKIFLEIKFTTEISAWKIKYIKFSEWIKFFFYSGPWGLVSIF